MAKRGWAKWGGPINEPQQSEYLRPSERRGAGQRSKPDAQSKRAAAGRAPDPAAVDRMRARLEPPKAPWHPLPLAELAIVIGVLFALVGAAISNQRAIGGGFLLVLLGTAEFSWREHRHGYRSHATVLAAVVAMIVALTLWFVAGAHRNVALGGGAAVFVVAWALLYRSYEPDSRLER